MEAQRQVHRWGLFEAAVEVPSARDPLRDVTVSATFVSPSGRRRTAPGFWDGGTTHRVRFSPDETGTWRYAIHAKEMARGPGERSVPGGRGQSPQESTFVCVPYAGDNPLYLLGHPRISSSRTHFVHADGRPLFFLADTVWNGAMRAATDDDWHHYVRTRLAQGFTAAMFVTTNWKGLPDGGPNGPSHYGLPDAVTGVNPLFYQHLDRRLEALAAAGIVPMPVLLWANGNPKDAGGSTNLNPGAGLPEEDAILLARYQVARWHAHPVMFVLNGDGRYTGEHAARWHRIGRAVFQDNEDRVPVALHCGGVQWLGPDFRDEPWVDVLGYQPGHHGTDAGWRWHAGLVGPDGDPADARNTPAGGWPEVSGKLAVNLEPPYEDHNRMQLAREKRIFERFSDEDVRRSLYWSLLTTPTAGTAYGGHGVWGWDDGSGPPIAHGLTGTPKPWREALELPGATQLRHLRDAFEALPWWTLTPDQSLLTSQSDDVMRYAVAARSADATLAVAYFPAGSPAALDASRLRGPVTESWLDPRTGERSMHHPADGDALLIARTG